MNVIIVRLRFRPRLASAILGIDVPECVSRSSFPEVVTSVYRTASTGETWAAVFPGLLQEIKTVTSETSAAPMKINGLAEIVLDCTPLSC